MVAGPMYQGRIYQREYVTEATHLMVDRRQREAGEGQGQATPEDLPLWTYFLQLGPTPEVIRPSQ
jgi:hypothetical protein